MCDRLERSFRNSHGVSLVGAPPDTCATKGGPAHRGGARTPYAVLLLDDIERRPLRVHFLLQVRAAGRPPDGQAAR